MEDHWKEFNEIEKHREDVIYRGITLTEAEVEANKTLTKLYENTKSTIPTQFHWIAPKYGEEVKQSELYDALQKMPKACLLHLHLDATLPTQWCIDKTYGPYFYVNFDTNQVKCNYENNDPAFVEIRKLREETEDKKAFDEKIRDLFEMPIDKMLVPNAWDEFYFRYMNRVQSATLKEFALDNLYETCISHIKDGFSALQVKIILGSWLDKTGFMTGNEQMESIQELLKKIQSEYPDFQLGIIFQGMRLWTTDQLKENLDKVFETKKKYPELVVGFDIAASEEKMPIDTYIHHLEEIQNNCEKEGLYLPFFLHGGETYNSGNKTIQHLTCLKNTKRIGHALNMFKNSHLYEVMRKKQICVELQPMSNNTIQFVKDLRMHPSLSYYHYGIPVCISDDDPGIYQTDITMDWFACVFSFQFDLRDLKRLVWNSIEHCHFTKQQTEIIEKDFTKKWDQWIQHMISLKK